MNQSHRSSFFNIKADLDRSHGAYIYDLNTKRTVLDLFSMYSSLPLGYNHPVFNTKEFVQESHTHLGIKVTNCEINTPAADRFISLFTNHKSMISFSHFHFACTGALAIEAAIKTALFRNSNGEVGLFEGSFHGINGYGGFIASKHGPAFQRLSGFPKGVFSLILKDVFDETTGNLVLQDIANKNLSCILVEPIQCTRGDKVLYVPFLQELSDYCTKQSIPLIFDEIQTGFGGTGSMWYFEQLGIIPDIVVFGKKTQVSGIMVREKYAQIFNQASRLEVTWDGDVLDMIRCSAILKAYDKYDILENVKWRGEQLEDGLKKIGLNVRRIGLLLAIDFENKSVRDDFVKHMWEDQAVIVIPTGEQCVRLRPNLAITAAEIFEVIQRINRVSRLVAA